MRRFSRLFEISLVAVLMATYLYAALSEAHNFATEWFIRDDAFYYFKVAQNISEGHGSTLDGINPTNGYHPLWMLICIPIFALARFDLILPLRIIVILSGAISAATGVLLFRLVRRALSPPAAILAATYWCFDRLIHYNVTQFGLETGLTALTMTAFLLALTRLPARGHPLYSRQLWTLGLLAVLMLLSRLDTVFLALLAGAWILLRGASFRTTLLLDATVIVFAAFTSLALRTGLPDYFTYTQSALALAALGLLIQIPAFYIFGLYQPPRKSVIANHEVVKQSPVEPEIASAGKRRLAMTAITNYHIRFLLATLLSAGLVAGGLIGLTWAGPLEGLPRSALPVYAGLVLVGAGMVRAARWILGSSRPAMDPLAEIREGWRQWLHEGLHYYGILGGALAAYMATNKILFGTFMPVSGQIKQWWGTLQGSTYGLPIDSLSGFLGLETEEGLNAWGPMIYRLHDLKNFLGVNVWLALALVMLAALAILAIRPKRAARASVAFALPVLFGGSIFQMFYYNGLGYAGSKDWYWVAQMLLVTLLGALLFDLVARPLSLLPSVYGPDTKAQSRQAANKKNFVTSRLTCTAPNAVRCKCGDFVSGISARPGLLLAWLITAALVIWFVVPFEFNLIQRMPYRAVPADVPYLDVTRFLESHTEPGALIGMTGGGNVGYFIEGRTIVNMDGLINSAAYFEALRAGRAGEYLANIGLDYIFSNPDILLNPPYNGQFDEWSLLVAQFGKKDLLKFTP
jgi:hypothetical protein